MVCLLYTIANADYNDCKSIVLAILHTDKFDQFWAVNRRLMEPNGDQEGFKHIPIRCYKEVGFFVGRRILEYGFGKSLEQLSTSQVLGVALVYMMH